MDTFNFQNKISNDQIEVSTMCHGCSYGGYNCGMIAYVKNDKLLKITGNPHHPLNKGRLCAKGQSAIQWVYNHQRLKYPLKRIGGKGSNRFKRITWNEALDLICDKITTVRDKYGPEFIALQKGQSSSWGGLHHLLLLRFLYALGSPNFTWWGPYVCYGPQLMYHKMTIGGPTYSRTDHDNADLIIEWFTSGGKGGAARRGDETIDTNLRSAPFNIISRLKKGARLIVINPQLIPLAANGRAYKWVPIRPGTDGALALAMINVIISEKLYDKDFVNVWCEGFDQLSHHVATYSPQWAEKITDISANDIINLSREYALTKKACIRFTESPEKSDLQTVATAIPILMAITGHLDRPGCNKWFYPTNRLGFSILGERLSEDIKNKVLGGDKFYIQSRGKMVADFPSVVNALITAQPYKPELMLIYGSNPLSTARNPSLMAQALNRLDFLVVFDLFLTPTARHADLILPASTRYECSSEPAIWENHLALSNKVIQPLWETRNELEVTLDIAAKLGMGSDFWNGNYEDMINEFLKPVNISLADLKTNSIKGIYFPKTEWITAHERFDKLFENLPNNKIQLYNKTLKSQGSDPMPSYKGEPEDFFNTPNLLNKYPLIFTDQHSDYLNHHSWMRSVPWLREMRKLPFVKINPKTAERYNIKNNDWIEIISPHGKIKAVAFLFEGIRPDTLMGQHGWWDGCQTLNIEEYPVLQGGINPNVLFNWSKKDPITSNITKNTLVRIRKTNPPKIQQPIKEVT